MTAPTPKAPGAKVITPTGVEYVDVIGGGPVSQMCTTQSIASLAAAGATGANPTGTAGPVAVNGTALTFLRSDGAPAVQKASNAQFGIAEGDGATITFVAGVGSTIGATAGPFTAITSITVVKGLITAITGT